MTYEDSRREYLFNLLQNPTEIEHLNTADLRIVLSSFLHIGRILNPIAQSLMNIENEEHQLRAESSSRKRCALKLFLSCIVLMAIVLGSLYYNQSQEVFNSSLGIFLTCISLALIVCFLVFLIFGLYAVIMQVLSRRKLKQLHSDCRSLNEQLTKELNTYVNYMI